MRLIDADEAKAMVKPYEKSDEALMCTGGTAIRLIHNAIDHAPTVDAVPVVRCRDCKHYGYDALGYTVCNAAVGLVYPEDDSYCSYGQRKDHMDGGENGTNH